MAADALVTAGAAVSAARPELKAIGSGAPGIPGFPSPDIFFQTLAAVGVHAITLNPKP